MFKRFFKKVRPPQHPHILFVCTANLCRSPMAEGLARWLTRESGWTISSAGFFVDHAVPPEPNVIDVLEGHGISIEGMVSEPLTREVIAETTHIFTMTDKQHVSLRKQYPKAADRAQLVGAFSSFPQYYNQDIPDPIGQGPEAFEETFRILSDAVPKIIESVAKSHPS